MKSLRKAILWWLSLINGLYYWPTYAGRYSQTQKRISCMRSGPCGNIYYRFKITDDWGLQNINTHGLKITTKLTIDPFKSNSAGLKYVLKPRSAYSNLWKMSKDNLAVHQQYFKYEQYFCPENLKHVTDSSWFLPQQNCWALSYSHEAGFASFTTEKCKYLFPRKILLQIQCRFLK